MRTDKVRPSTPLSTAALIAAATLPFFSGCEIGKVEPTAEPAAAPSKSESSEHTNEVVTNPEPESAPNELTNETITRSEPATVDPKFQGYETVVSDTHAASLAARKNARAKVAATDKCWPYKAWGDTMWALCAL